MTGKCGRTVRIGSEEAIQQLRQSGYKPRINHKGTRTKSLSGRQKQVNCAYSKVRARVEHVFGTMRNEMPERQHALHWAGASGKRGLGYEIFATT